MTDEESMICFKISCQMVYLFDTLLIHSSNTVHTFNVYFPSCSVAFRGQPGAPGAAASPCKND